jgi:hypothetical protein
MVARRVDAIDWPKKRMEGARPARKGTGRELHSGVAGVTEQAMNGIAPDDGRTNP